MASTFPWLGSETCNMKVFKLNGFTTGAHSFNLVVSKKCSDIRLRNWGSGFFRHHACHKLIALRSNISPGFIQLLRDAFMNDVNLNNGNWGYSSNYRQKKI